MGSSGVEPHCVDNSVVLYVICYINGSGHAVEQFWTASLYSVHALYCLLRWLSGDCVVLVLCCILKDELAF